MMKFYKIIILSLFAVTLISCGGAEERKAAYLEKALASIESGDTDKARIELKNVLQIDPKHGEAYYYLGTIFEKKKDYRKAYSHYLKADELNPVHLANQARLGRFYLLLLNDVETAQQKAHFILAKEPENPDGLLLKAAITLRDKNIAGAIEISKDIISKDPNHVEAATFLATLYAKENNNEEAIKTLDNALENNQNHEQLNNILATILVKDKDYERAENIYVGFLERNPDISSSYNNLAAFYDLTGDKVKSEEILRSSVDNDPDSEDRILTLIKYINSVKGSEDAIKQLNAYVIENSGIGKLRIALAELYLLNSEKESAIEILKTAINEFSEEVTGITARTNLALIYIQDKEYDKASVIIEDATLITPNDPNVNFLRAKFAVTDKDLEKAIISLRIVTKEMPENIDAYILLANVYQQERNKEQVNNTLNSAYENNKTNPDALLKLAKYHANSDVVQASKIIDAYNAIKGTTYDGLSLKVLILNKSKKFAEANEVAKQLVESYPDKPSGYLQAIPYFSQKGDAASAVSLLEQGYIKVKDNRKILFLLTTLQVEDKKFDIVEKRLKAELNSAPEDMQIKILLAKVYLLRDGSDLAEPLLEEITVSNPAIEETYILLSQVYQSKKKADASKEILIKGKRNVKASYKIPLRLANMYEAEESYSEAITIYRELNELYPDNLVVVNNLLSLQSDFGTGEVDVKLNETLVDKLKESDQPVFSDTIGWVYYKAADYKNAIKYLLMAVEKMPEVNVFNYHLAMAYKMTGDSEQAKIYLEKSLAGKKDFKERSAAEAALNSL